MKVVYLFHDSWGLETPTIETEVSEVGIKIPRWFDTPLLHVLDIWDSYVIDVVHKSLLICSERFEYP